MVGVDLRSLLKKLNPQCTKALEAAKRGAGGRIQRESTEQMELELVPLDELYDGVLRGEIRDSPSALAILLVHQRIADPAVARRQARR